MVMVKFRMGLLMGHDRQGHVIDFIVNNPRCFQRFIASRSKAIVVL